ncbi:MAG: sulfur reduction protein DsrS, partial [Gammaproteobacteria bacterium]|nr:sulfur reduction protein DsrS [Gammaproteobacteria bacterium]
MVELSHEDELRLSIMLTEPLYAVRIDENRMILHALLERGEINFPLSPNCQATRYLKQVREYLSSHALGSPGGYPVFLQRWARMGQIRGDTLAGLLCIGEPEAVVAAAHVPALTLELARRVWWASPTAEIARQLLRRTDFVATDLGQTLAHFLLEDLPFEQESRLVVESVALLLQPGLLALESRTALWHRAQRHAGYLTGFLIGAPDDLPSQTVAHPDHAHYAQQLTDLANQNNHYARMLLRVTSAAGQTYATQLTRAIHGVADQDTVIALFETIADYFSPAQSSPTHDAAALACLSVCPHAAPQLSAIKNLEAYNSNSLNDILGRTDAVGSVMRKKLMAVTDPLIAHIQGLMKEEKHG